MSGFQGNRELIQQVEQLTKTVSVDGVDVEFSCKVSVRPEARVDGDYKISFSLLRSHGSGSITKQTVIELLDEAFAIGEEVLDEYFSSRGGRQLDLFQETTGAAAASN